VQLISLFNMMSMCVQHETLCKHHLRGMDCIHYNLMTILKKGSLTVKANLKDSQHSVIGPPYEKEW
jgi:hypothetical protein